MSEKSDKQTMQKFYSYMKAAGYNYPPNYPLRNPYYPPQDYPKDEKQKKTQNPTESYSQMYGYPPYPYSMPPMSYPQPYTETAQEGKRDEDKGKHESSNPYSYYSYSHYPYYNPYAYHPYYYGQRDYSSKPPSSYFYPPAGDHTKSFSKDKTDKNEIVISSDSEQGIEIIPKFPEPVQKPPELILKPPVNHTILPPSPPQLLQQSTIGIPAVTQNQPALTPVNIPYTPQQVIIQTPPLAQLEALPQAPVSLPAEPTVPKMDVEVQVQPVPSKVDQVMQQQVVQPEKKENFVIVEQSQDPFFIHKKHKIVKQEKPKAVKVFRPSERLNTRYAGMDSEAYKEMMKKQARARLDMYYERERQRREQERIDKEKDRALQREKVEKEKADKEKEKEKADKQKIDKVQRTEEKKGPSDDKSQKEKKDKSSNRVATVPAVSVVQEKEKQAKRQRIKDDHPLKELRYNQSHGRIRLGAYFQSTIPNLLPHKGTSIPIHNWQCVGYSCRNDQDRDRFQLLPSDHHFFYCVI